MQWCVRTSAWQREGDTDTDLETDLEQREVERSREGERERGLILLNLHQTAASPALPTCWTRDFGLGSTTHTEYRHNLVVAIVVELLLTSYAGCPARVARAAGADGAC